MADIQIRPVVTGREKRIFLTFPWKIYQNDPLWVPPLIPERKKVIDPARGTFFRRGAAEFFIAWRNGEPVGTICAAEDYKAHDARGWKEGIFGFFEVIEDYSVAEALLDFVCEWAKTRGLGAVWGPFNLDYEDAYGILLEGRDRPPAIFCGHTPPYYLDFVERYGFVPARAANIALAYDLTQEVSEMERKLHEGARRVRERKDFIVRGADFSRWEEEADRVFVLINQALAHLPGHVPWQREALYALLEPFKDIADPDLVLFAEDEGEVVGFFPGVPNLNEFFIQVNGLRYPWNYLKLLLKMRGQPDCLAVKSVLVLPEYWGSGVSLLLFDEMAKRAREKGYRWVDLSLTSEDNPKTPMLGQRMGAKVYKRYMVFRKFLDPELESRVEPIPRSW